MVVSKISLYVILMVDNVFVAMGQVEQEDLAWSEVQCGHRSHLGGWSEDRGLPGLQQTLRLGEPPSTEPGGELRGQFSSLRLLH